MKAHGINQTGQPIRDTSVASSPRKNTSKSSGKGKKRTFEEYQEQSSTGDDDEGLPKAKQEVLSKVKPESKSSGSIKQEVNGYYIIEHDPPIKPDPSQLDGASEGSIGGIPQYSHIHAYQNDKKTLFNDFLKPGMLEDQKGEAVHGDTYDGAFNMDSVNSGIGGTNALGDSIVIADWGVVIS